MIEMSGSDEQEFIEWIKSKAESVKEANIYESKSWLLTGTSIFPNNISLKMVSYMTSKQDKNVALSSITLTSMLNNPENDSNVELQEEVNSLLKSMLSDCTSPEDKINSDIFKCIPKDMQANILKKAALECQDVIMKCSLLLLLIKTNSFYAREYGLMLVEALFEAEIKDSPNNRNNVYRRYFANDALPLLLSENSAATEKKILLSWLDKAFQYYIIIAFQSGKEGFRSLTSTASVPSSTCSKATRPWDSLAELLTLTAKQVKVWNISIEHFKSEDVLVQYLTSLKERLEKDYRKTVKREFIYIGTYVLLKLVYNYNGLIRNQEPVCLIQSSFADKPVVPKKHRKVSSNTSSTLSVAPNIQNGDKLMSTFKSACSVWTMLHSDSSYAKGFTEILDRLDYPMWKSSLAGFSRDRIVYQQEYKSYPVSTDGATESGCYRLQKACCQYALALHREACKEILEIITDDSVNSVKTCSCQDPPEIQQPSIVFTFLSSPQDVFNHGVDLLIFALKGCLTRNPANITCIEYLCVLSQLHWPKHKSQLFDSIRSLVKATGKFTFTNFFSYIINVEILEEIAYLRTEQGGNVVLEIQPASSAKQRTVTRGVSRDAQEDIKAAFERQVARSSECVDHLVINFLKEKKNDIAAVF